MVLSPEWVSEPQAAKSAFCSSYRGKKRVLEGLFYFILFHFIFTSFKLKYSWSTMLC